MPPEISNEQKKTLEKFKILIKPKQTTNNNEKDKINPIDIASQILKYKIFVTLKDTEEILIYKDGCYHKYGEQEIKKISQFILGDKWKSHTVNEIIKNIKSRTFIDRSEFNANPFEINLKNGIYNLVDRKLEPHDPSHLSVTQLDFEYDPDAECPKILKFLNEILEPQDVKAMIEFFGFCLFKENFIERFFILNGAGSNGKSTLLALLRYFLNINNCSSATLQYLEENRFASANLYGKLANISADIPSTSLKSTSMIKMLTGSDDLITAEHKGQNSFQFVNHAKLIFSCNTIPNAWDDTDAFYKRIRIINFPNEFIGKENINLRYELKEELSGLFNVAIEGLWRLLKNKKFSNDLSIEESKNIFLRKSSSVFAFAIDELEADSLSRIGKQYLLSKYQKYCIENKLPIVSDKKFFQNIPKIFNVAEMHSNDDGIREREYYGIKLKHPEWEST